MLGYLRFFVYKTNSTNLGLAKPAMTVFIIPFLIIFLKASKLGNSL